MITPSDHFASSFDSISVTPRREDEPVHERTAPAPAEQPGFYLLDNANGRFVIDRDTGIVTLQDEHLLSIEAGAIHPVHIRVIELSGGHYELKLRLRMTGRVPQIAGSEENDILAGLAAAPLMDLMTPEEKSVHEVVAPEPPPLAWVRYSAASMLLGKRPLYGETAPFGALFETPAVFPDVYVETAKLGLDAMPPAASATDAAWVI